MPVGGPCVGASPAFLLVHQVGDVDLHLVEVLGIIISSKSPLLLEDLGDLHVGVLEYMIPGDCLDDLLWTPRD